MLTAQEIHAMAVHFPIALIITAFLSEIIFILNKKVFYRYATFYILILGVTGTMVAYSSGNYASNGLRTGLLKTPLQMHEDAATITLWLAIITVIFKGLMYKYNYQKTWARWISFLLFVVLVGYVVRSSFFGYELVYKHGAGVELALPDFTE